jgi:hypothetical protein
VPLSLWDTAVRVNQLDSYYTGNDLTTKTINSVRGLFGEKNERIAIISFLSDTNDWGIIRPVEDVGCIEMSYLNGREEPEIIVDDSLSEAAFKGDAWLYKVRHEYQGALVEYRSAYKSVVS